MPVNKDLENAYLQLEKLIAERQQFEKIKTQEFKEKNISHPAIIPNFQSDINFADINKKTLLDYAVEMDDFEKVKQLIDQGAKVKSKRLISSALKNGNLNLAQLLYKNGGKIAGINIINCLTEEGKKWLFDAATKELENSFDKAQFLRDAETIAEKAAAIGNKELLKKIFLTYPKLTKRNNKILNNAIETGQINFVISLLDSGIPINPFSTYAESALHRAVKHDYIDIFNLLINRNADINKQDFYKQTPLMLAVANKNLSMMEKLLELKADISKIDIDGFTVLHHIAKSGNLTALQMLLAKTDTKQLLEVTDIYGRTALDIAKLENKLDIYNELAKHINPSKTTRIDFQTRINQVNVLKKMQYYLRTHYRDVSILGEEGNCNGFAYLFQHYASKGMKDYFFNTMALMAKWDGSVDALLKPFTDDMPQAKYYKSPGNNLEHLFEQWINDVVWFQHLRIESATSQYDRVYQQRIIGDQGDDQPIYLLGRNFAKFERYDQVEEYLQYLSRLPPGLQIEFSDYQHTTSAYKDKDGFVYYDSNIRFETADALNYKQVTQQFLDYAHILISQKNPDSWNTTDYVKNWSDMEVFYFNRDAKQIDFANFHVFSPSELTKESVQNFQSTSANRFTPLHVAVIMNSILDVKQLITDGYCDVNAIDSQKRSALDLAIQKRSKELIETILSSPQFDFKQLSNQQMDNIYNIGAHEFLIKHPNISDLNGLLKAAISKSDVQMVTKLISTNKVNLNKAVGSDDELPLKLALKLGNSEMIKVLLENGANPLIKKPGHISPLEYAIQNNTEIACLMVRYTGSINAQDDNGKSALHYAASSFNVELLRELLKQPGINTNLKDRSGHTPLSSIMGLFVPEDDKEMKRKECVNLLLSKCDINLTDDKQMKSFVYLLLNIVKNTEDQFSNETLRNLSQLMKNTDFINQKETNEYDPFNSLTPLQIAAFRGNIEHVKLLLAAGADPNIPIGSRNDLIHFLISNKKLTTELLDVLLQSSLKISEDIQKTLSTYDNSAIREVWDKHKDKVAAREEKPQLSNDQNAKFEVGTKQENPSVWKYAKHNLPLKSQLQLFGKSRYENDKLFAKPETHKKKFSKVIHHFTKHFRK